MTLQGYSVCIVRLLMRVMVSVICTLTSYSVPLNANFILNGRFTLPYMPLKASVKDKSVVVMAIFVASPKAGLSPLIFLFLDHFKDIKIFKSACHLFKGVNI